MNTFCFFSVCMCVFEMSPQIKLVRSTLLSHNYNMAL